MKEKDKEPNQAASENLQKEAQAIVEKREKRTATFKKYFFMVVAGLFYALSIDLFVKPNNIVSGAMTGLATLFHALWGWEIGVVTIILNIPILLLGLKKEGWRFILDCLLTILVLGGLTDGLALLIGDYTITDNKLLAAMYAGLLQGVAVGLYLKYRVSSGGTELLGRLIYNKIKVGSMPAIIAVLDAIIVLAGTIVLKNPENLLYVLILLFISSKISDIVLVGLNQAKLCYIITNRPSEVSAEIMNNLKRGVTKIESVGMYTNTSHSMLMVCVRPAQVTQLRNLLRNLDDKAFVMVSDASEVYGEGFKRITM